MHIRLYWLYFRSNKNTGLKEKLLNNVFNTKNYSYWSVGVYCADGESRAFSIDWKI